MRVLSIHTGTPQKIEIEGKEILTSIFKKRMDAPVRISLSGLEGDQQANLEVHGGKYKAVYSYPTEHYPYWKKSQPQHLFEAGAFGENLMTEGLLENEVAIGDIFKVGTSILRVTQPRFPCFKLGVKFKDKGMIMHFHKSQRPGIYFEVIEEGIVEPGSRIETILKSGGTTILDFVQVHAETQPKAEALKAILSDQSLIDEWKVYFTKKLKTIS